MGASSTIVNARRNAGPFFQYPDTLSDEVSGGQHFMMITAHKTEKATQTLSGSGGDIGPISRTWALYIPPGSLKTNYMQNYETMAGGRLAINMQQAGSSGIGEMGAALAAVDEKMRGGSSLLDAGAEAFRGMGISLDSLMSGGQSAVLGAGKYQIWSMGRKALGAQKQIFAGSATAMNDHMALVYSGPGAFRKHTFNFVFYTKNSTEANQVSKIIEGFKISMHPDLGGVDIKLGNSKINTGSGLDSLFFHYPDLFKIKFMIGGSGATAKKHYFEILPSVLESMNVSYDAENMVAMHKDGTPVGVKLDLTFQETTHVVAGSQRNEVFEAPDLAGHSSQSPQNFSARESRS